MYIHTDSYNFSVYYFANSDNLLNAWFIRPSRSIETSDLNWRRTFEKSVYRRGYRRAFLQSWDELRAHTSVVTVEFWNSYLIGTWGHDIKLCVVTPSRSLNFGANSYFGAMATAKDLNLDERMDAVLTTYVTDWLLGYSSTLQSPFPPSSVHVEAHVYRHACHNSTGIYLLLAAYFHYHKWNNWTDSTCSWTQRFLLLRYCELHADLATAYKSLEASQRDGFVFMSKARYGFGYYF